MNVRVSLLDNYMTDEKIKLIQWFEDKFEDMPDGAYFALAEEYGIDQDDWIEYCDDLL